MARARNQYGTAAYRRAANCNTSATTNIDTSTTTPSFLWLTNMSEMASPAAVVEILITQNSTVTSGSLSGSVWITAIAGEEEPTPPATMVPGVSSGTWSPADDHRT